MNESLARAQEVTLVDLLDRVIDRGVVLTGDVTLSVANVDLLYVGLRVLLAPVDRLQELLPQAGGEPAVRGGP
jgi:gas vesicle structural protein